jgi:WD40 repeat protein
LLGKRKFIKKFLLRISFSSGTRKTGDILLYDVRQKECIIKFQHHRQEVCGLKWCPNGRYLASGSNDNTVCVWDFHQWYSNGSMSTTNNPIISGLSSLLPPADGYDKKSNSRTKPLWHFKEHQAAVKVNLNISLFFVKYIVFNEGYCLVSMGRFESVSNWWWSFRWLFTFLE